MFSVLGASVFVPFLPMRPIQILAKAPGERSSPFFAA
jgi:hypothetical protein